MNRTIKYIDEAGKVIWSELLTKEKLRGEKKDVMLDRMKYKIVGTKVVDGLQVIIVKKQ